jgi:hypothetical protein
MKEIRGDLRTAAGTPSDDEDGAWGLEPRKKSSAGFVLRPSNMRDYQAEGAATGLENLFNSAFTIEENTLAGSKKENESINEHNEKGFVMDGETVRENVMVMRAVAALCALLAVFFGAAIAMGWFNSKTAIESLLYEKETLEGVHDVVEDFVQDPLGS